MGGRTLGGVKPGGYIASGIGAGLVGVLVLLIAHSDDGLQRAMAAADAASGQTPHVGSDLTANLVAVGLFLVALVLVLIGSVGVGVKSSRSN